MLLKLSELINKVKLFEFLTDDKQVEQVLNIPYGRLARWQKLEGRAPELRNKKALRIFIEYCLERDIYINDFLTKPVSEVSEQTNKEEATCLTTHTGH